MLEEGYDETRCWTKLMTYTQNDLAKLITCAKTQLPAVDAPATAAVRSVLAESTGGDMPPPPTLDATMMECGVAALA